MAKGDYAKIPRRHIPSYKRVVEFLIRTHGSITKAIEAAGISDHAYYRLVNDDELSASVARKIIDCYCKTTGKAA